MCDLDELLNLRARIAAAERNLTQLRGIVAKLSEDVEKMKPTEQPHKGTYTWHEQHG